VADKCRSSSWETPQVLEGTSEANRHHRALMWVAERYKRAMYEAQLREDQTN
jgi:hypothetical protein